MRRGYRTAIALLRAGLAPSVGTRAVHSTLWAQFRSCIPGGTAPTYMQYIRYGSSLKSVEARPTRRGCRPLSALLNGCSHRAGRLHWLHSLVDSAAASGPQELHACLFCTSVQSIQEDRKKQRARSGGLQTAVHCWSQLLPACGDPGHFPAALSA
jgi:hypothetical protein